MDKRLKTFWNELLEHCKKHNKYEFIYTVEYWGILWTPWFIYINNESLKFSLNDLSRTDLNWLIDNEYILFVEALQLDDKIDMQRELYKIIKFDN